LKSRWKSRFFGLILEPIERPFEKLRVFWFSRLEE